MTVYHWLSNTPLQPINPPQPLEEKEVKAQGNSWTDMLQVASVAKNISYQEILILKALLPQVRALVHAVVNIAQDVMNNSVVDKKAPFFVKYLTTFLHNTGFSSPHKIEGPNFNVKIKNLNDAITNLQATIPASLGKYGAIKPLLEQIKKISIDVQIAADVSTLLGINESLLNTNCVRHASGFLNRLIEKGDFFVYQGDNIPGELCSNGGTLRFLGIYEKFFTYNDMLAQGINLIAYTRQLVLYANAIPSIVRLIQNKDQVVALKNAVSNLLFSGQPWPAGSLILRLDSWRVLTEIFKNEQVKAMVHNLVRHLTVKLAEKMGQQTGAALAASIGIVMAPLMTALKWGSFISAPGAMAESAGAFLGIIATKSDPSGKAKTVLQLGQLLAGSLSPQAWLEWLASGPVVFQLGVKELSGGGVDVLLQDRELFYKVFDYLLLNLFNKEELQQWNNNPNNSKDFQRISLAQFENLPLAQGLDLAQTFGDLLKTADSPLERAKKLQEGYDNTLEGFWNPGAAEEIPMLARTLHTLLGQVEEQFGVEKNIHLYETLNQSLLRKITTAATTFIFDKLKFIPLRIIPQPARIEAKEEPDLTVLQAQWAKKEAAARASLAQFTAQQAAIKTTIKNSPLPDPLTPKSLEDWYITHYMQIVNFDTQIKAAEAEADCHQARIVFNSKSLFRIDATKDLLKDLMAATTTGMTHAMTQDVAHFMAAFKKRPTKDYPTEATYSEEATRGLLHRINPANNPALPQLEVFDAVFSELTLETIDTLAQNMKKHVMVLRGEFIQAAFNGKIAELQQESKAVDYAMHKQQIAHLGDYASMNTFIAEQGIAEIVTETYFSTTYEFKDQRATYKNGLAALDKQLVAMELEKHYQSVIQSIQALLQATPEEQTTSLEALLIKLDSTHSGYIISTMFPSYSDYLGAWVQSRSPYIKETIPYRDDIDAFNAKIKRFFEVLAPYKTSKDAQGTVLEAFKGLDEFRDLVVVAPSVATVIPPVESKAVAVAPPTPTPTPPAPPLAEAQPELPVVAVKPPVTAPTPTPLIKPVVEVKVEAKALVNPPEAPVAPTLTETVNDKLQAFDQLLAEKNWDKIIWDKIITSGCKVHTQAKSKLAKSTDSQNVAFIQQSIDLSTMLLKSMQPLQEQAQQTPQNISNAINAFNALSAHINAAPKNKPSSRDKLLGALASLLGAAMIIFGILGLKVTGGLSGIGIAGGVLVSAYGAKRFFSGTQNKLPKALSDLEKDAGTVLKGFKK